MVQPEALLGALVGAGIPEDHAKDVRGDVKNGGTMLGVHPRTDEDRDYLRKQYDTYKADNVYTTY